MASWHQLPKGEKMKVNAVLIFLLMTLSPALAYATLISYEASGTVTYEVDNKQIDMSLKGSARIDDQVNRFGRDHKMFEFEISDFVLSTDYDFWTASSGYLHFEDEGGAAFRDCFIDVIGHGKMQFKNENGVDYDPFNFDPWLTLPPQITIFHEYSILNDSIYKTLSANIVLTRTAPVPEPSTLLLVGIGLSSFILIRKGKNNEK